MEGRSFCKLLKQTCKKCVMPLIRHLPRLPAGVWDAYVDWKLGSEPLEDPVVLYLAKPGLDPQQTRITDLPAKVQNIIRIVIVSDTHERHRLVRLPEGDVFLHCGDICMSSSLTTRERGKRVLTDFNSWLEDVPCREKVVIGGNHDEALLELGKENTEVLSNAIWLQNSAVNLKVSGIRVYGHAYSEGSSHNDAWQTPGMVPSISPDECRDADVVMTHSLSDLIKKEILSLTRPRVWASGHIHKSHGILEKDGTVFANAAVMNASYRPLQPPIVVDLPVTSTGPVCSM